MAKAKQKITAPSFSPSKIAIKHFGRSKRIKVIDAITDQPIINNKKENKPMQNNKLFGIVYLIVKMSLLVAGITMIKMEAIHLFVEIPAYQIVGGVLLLSLGYLELEPHFTKGKKARKDTKFLPQQKPSDFIET